MAKQVYARIPVEDRKAATDMERALEDPAMKAFVLIVGALKPLSQRARQRVLSFVADKLDEDSARLTITTDERGRHDIEAAGELPAGH